MIVNKITKIDHLTVHGNGHLKSNKKDEKEYEP